MKKMNFKKDNGIYYTPKQLANFIAKLIIIKPNSKIFDPCFGEGALILSAYKQLIKLGAKFPQQQLFGYDLHSNMFDNKKDQIKKLFKQENFQKNDFFSVNSKNIPRKFDIILMNPPYVRHHLISKNKQKYLNNLTSDLGKFPYTSDLWVYFIVHSLKFIRKNGNVAFILPWSFLYADFAKIVRKLLLDKFKKIKIIAIGRQMFENNEERIIILLGFEFDHNTTDIEIFYSYNIPNKKMSWIPVKKENWIDSPIKILLTNKNQQRFSKIINELGFKPLGDFAKIKIGIVTGANNFFIFDKDKAEEKKIPKELLKPIIRHSKNLCQLSISLSNGINDRILFIPDNMKLFGSLQEYIKNGEKNKLNEGYHTRKRTKWYSIPIQKPPNGFLHYMTKEIPFIVLNPEKIFSTNTIHNIYFSNGTNENTIKWIQFSLLTSISQLSIELEARTYGGGILKIEPTAASKILVYPGNDKPFPKKISNKLNKLLNNGKRNEAMKFTDNWFKTNLGISEEVIQNIYNNFKKMRDIRLGKY